MARRHRRVACLPDLPTVARQGQTFRESMADWAGVSKDPEGEPVANTDGDQKVTLPVEGESIRAMVNEEDCGNGMRLGTRQETVHVLGNDRCASTQAGRRGLESRLPLNHYKGLRLADQVYSF